MHTKMELLPAVSAASPVFRGGPFSLAHNREPRAINDEMDAFVWRNSMKRKVEALAPPGERRVIGRGELEAHHRQE